MQNDEDEISDHSLSDELIWEVDLEASIQFTPAWISRRTRSQINLGVAPPNNQRPLQSNESSSASSGSSANPRNLSFNMATSDPVFDKELSGILLRILQIDVKDTPLHEIAEGPLLRSQIPGYLICFNDVDKIRK